MANPEKNRTFPFDFQSFFLWTDMNSTWLSQFWHSYNKQLCLFSIFLFSSFTFSKLFQNKWIHAPWKSGKLQLSCSFWKLLRPPPGWLTLLFKSILFMWQLYFLVNQWYICRARIVLVKFYCSPNPWSISSPPHFQPPKAMTPAMTPVPPSSWSYLGAPSSLPSSLPFIPTCLLFC